MKNTKDNDNKKPNSFWNSKATKWMITFIIIAIIIAIILVIVFVRKDYTETKDIYFLQDQITRAADSTGDNVYLTKFTDNGYAGRFEVTMIDGNVPNSFYVYAMPWQKEGFYKSVNYLLINDKNTIDSLKNALISPNGENGVLNAALVPSNSASAWIRAIPSVIITIIMIIFFFLMFKSSGQISGITQSKSQAIRVESKVKFSDIAGNEEAKEEVMELVDYLKNPKKYSAAGARIPKGILLGGPPGTGKTLLAKATAGEAKVPFLFISASSFVELFVGMGAKRVREMFREARKSSPAIIFIDELDAVGRSRGAGIGGGNDEREQTLNQLLVEMDGITENSGILIMAATNRTDVLDPALLRPGRFDRTITVGLPDVKEREAILKLHARGKRIDKTINFAQVAKRTPGFSGAQLENVVNEASLLSVREKTGVITIEQIDEAIDRVMSGPAKKSRTISKEENIAVAYHEAGHAVVGIKIKGGNKVQKITIIPRGNAGGYNLMMPEEEKYNRSKKDLIAIITSFMGGRAAERLIYGEENVSTGASDDISKATQIARRMVTEWGMSELGPIKYEEDSSNPFLGRDYTKNASFSSKVGQEIDLAVRKIIMEADKKASEILAENRELLELIKEALVIKETIVAEEIEYISTHMKLPPQVLDDKAKYGGSEPTTELDFDTLINEVEKDNSKSEQKTTETNE
ncbi:ATP-dependent zinc metalloprotease FtsH [Mycoplasma miroungirhinis]|uniref:ATP-dependent zinc metalloprotease FtsH n=1 Tax=Mycoplasma miroungirhinis TaxID=754516 RepID=A0A6M4JBI3_9MOLU|nr:ATP-dependent zinc metalloprotease FtsH [Mycoplasma miroungirhinis]QJR44324.1 ATP-dependent zinc metalloprotease FtsH [Mycoplasma miroungirhinis]